MIPRALLAALLLLLPASASARPPTLIVDAGHGGSNLGALGVDGQLPEKRVTLQLARRTASFLVQWVPGARVLLTRDGDEYLTLAERVRLANVGRADLFVSLHCNASESRSRDGFETFFLSRDAAAAEALRREPTGGAVSSILSDLRLAATQTESLALARRMQRSLRAVRGPRLDRGVRQAPFDLLLGLTMPGVLVEVGYIDHPVEGRELLQPAAQERIAVAVAAALIEHWHARSRLTTAGR